jgi:hypothetical protein
VQNTAVLQELGNQPQQQAAVLAAAASGAVAAVAAVDVTVLHQQH